MKKYFTSFLMVLAFSLMLLLSACGTANDAQVEDTETDAVETEDNGADATSVATENANYEMTTLDWSAQPPTGLIKGDYYYTEERFRQGHLGTLEVVKNDDGIVYVEFNEMTRPNYYNRFFQDVPKRLSEYNFSMGEKKGAAWIQSVVLVESQMITEQRLTGEFDVVSGASNSIDQSMLPMAEVIEQQMTEASNQSYYGIAEDIGGGLTGFLQVVLDGDTITSVRYDELFADHPDDIEDPALKQYYRQSKYESVIYDEPSRIGFNVQMDALNEKVINTQDLLDLSELPAIDESGDYASSGFTIRNDAWDNYLMLAEKIQAELIKDGLR
ncbi:hypothetical protein GCM10012290_06970 [Halolactibacillus alkaliphilus]|uniref:FMN-binding domain-containing protein n=1 Tax=Halolactibacillus alkaliphilus TaxID=442899 RepID=A0A511WZN5_9BACI|nr:FMN-binding protein [Halolactibacillus alkaliphilus]GEN56149.1 hypothetical protein HAL01_06130 [Halolactibacillus alkaliphilus]GGN66878.1 hypothetical protein GCM10012290_06970 [Halolactibacillus alkaliphilus]SFO71950.1 hypothetical protein SAMN05720591_10671 [Halolactibacillus alkaliphilus]